MKPVAEAIGLGRSLQLGGACDLNADLARGRFRCTLEEYCEALNAANPLGTSTCIGDLEQDFSVISQDTQCLESDSSTSWIQANYRVCYALRDRSDYFQTTGVRRSFDIDFYEGFSFNYYAEAELCPDNPRQQCSCVASLEGRPCNSCQVCNDGFASGNAYLYALDCTNIATGLTRTCDPTFSWGDFFELVEESNLSPLVSQTKDPSLLPTQSPLPAPTTGTEKGIEDDSDPSTPGNKGLSTAALGGIVGGAGGIGLALILAVILILVLRGRNSGFRTGSKAAKDSNQVIASPPNTTEAPETDQSPPFQPIMASQVVLLNGQRETGLMSPNVATKRTDMPRFKDQVHS